MINTAMPVIIGNEVGLGRFTNIYTHGAYQSILRGFPVDFKSVWIGDNVWIPGATILPGVTIGANVVIGVGSVVTKDIPSGSLAAGIPAEVIPGKFFPRPKSISAILKILNDINKRWDLDIKEWSGVQFRVEKKTVFDVDEMSITGPVTIQSERVRNILRRYGIRFKVETDSGEYKPWQ